MNWCSSSRMARSSRRSGRPSTKHYRHANKRKASAKQRVMSCPNLGGMVLLFERSLHVEHRTRPIIGLAFIVLLVTCNSFGADQSNVQPRADYANIAALLKPFIEQQIAEKQLPALSIAIVDDQQIVWAQGFGFSDPSAKVPATAQTVYRIGSVSKLFTDIGIMQMVERGQLKLDVPITEYLPDFHPRNLFGKAITLRQLMSHQSGLLREPPVGNYFDPTELTLTETVHSLNGTELVYPPATHLKYSNAAIATVGYVLEKRSGEPF